ncbi:MAG: ThuA domain-containing protein [Promethearchaeota archaeon]
MNSNKKALIIWGGWSGHTPYPSSLLMQDILEEEDYEVLVENSLEPYLDYKLLSSMDLVIHCWTQANEKEHEIMMGKGGTSNLSNAILDGLGFVGWHGGLNDSFRNDTEFAFLIGSTWVAHPGGVIDFEVNISKPDDPIVKGLNDFKLKSEQYYCQFDPGIISGVNGEVLATTTFKHPYGAWNGVVMPFVYKRWWGDGKIFYAAFGHTFADFNVPETVEIMKRGMLWATRSED